MDIHQNWPFGQPRLPQLRMLGHCSSSLKAQSIFLLCYSMNYTCEARRARSACVQSTPIDITHVLLNRLTVSHATEKFWSKMAVHAYGTVSYFHYQITRVFAEILAHGEISAQRELYPNSFKCTAIFSPFLCLQKDIQQTVW